MTAHVNNLVKVCSFHLRQLRLIRRSLDFDAAHAFIRAFIHSRLDYCNSVLSGVPDYLLGRLQTVLNSSACLLLQLPGRESVSIRMRNELHWLWFPTADHIQTVPVDVQSAPRSGSGLPGATLCLGFIRRGSSSSEVSFHRSTRRAANIQENIWRQGIRKLRIHLMELSVQFSERRLSVAPLFQETLENSPILTCCFCRHSEYEI